VRRPTVPEVKVGMPRTPGCGPCHVVGAAPGARVSPLNPGKAYPLARLHLRLSSYSCSGGMVYGIVMGTAMLALVRAFHLPRGTDTGGSNLEQSRKIVSGPLPERDGTV
jgi:hypothetical protein